MKANRTLAPKWAVVVASLAVSAGLWSCGGDSGPKGKVQVFVEAEDSIPNGLDPGTGGENIVDGWTVRYTKFLVSIGNFRASRSAAQSDKLSDSRTHVLDMKNLPAGGFILAEFPSVTAARWDKVGFDMPNAAAASACAPGVSTADCALMKGNGYSVYVEATFSKANGQSCRPGVTPADCVPRASHTIAWGLKAGTAFDDCAPPQGDAGFAVPTSGTVQVKPTIHGDHWFFSNITQGAEMTERRAQWIVDADADRNGSTTLDELRLATAAALFPSPTYNLSGALASMECATVSSGYCYALAQARTLGDYQGEGECPTRRVLP
jgi:hypothetical protein